MSLRCIVQIIHAFTDSCNSYDDIFYQDISMPYNIYSVSDNVTFTNSLESGSYFLW